MVPSRVRSRQVRGASALAGGLAVAIAIALAGCTAQTAPAPEAQTAASASPSPSPTPEKEPVLIPEGTAQDNLAYFDLVNSRFLDENPTPGGRPIIDSLVAAGFDKTAMQVTPDSTAIGRDVDSIQFSVLWGDECLIGQSSGSGYISTVGPAVSGGTCLIGTTRAIDW